MFRYFSIPAALLLAGLAGAQPRIGTLDFYGLRKIPQSRIRQTLGVKEGDPLPPSKGDAEQRLDQLPGVIESHLEAVCCEDGKAILYVGIEEPGSPHFDIREAPDGDAKLPADVSEAYQNFLDADRNALRSGVTAEDLTRGYARSADPLTRAAQDMFPALAMQHSSDLRAVLHDSDDEEARAIAAYVAGYNSDRKTAIADLQYALKDADPGVRVNAVHGLMALAVSERLDPDPGVRVEPTWFIEMLNSLSWSDRSHALAALQILTDKRDPEVLEEMRERALPSLVEMARWKTLAHALPAYILLGRIAGIPEARIQAEWSKGNRDAVISAALKKKPPK